MMNSRPKKSKHHYLPVKLISVMSILVSAIALMSYGFDEKSHLLTNKETIAAAKDSIASVRAFEDVYKVLMSPRCMNCHPAGDIPLQGDDSHLHTMFPKRGKDGKGLYAMKCSNCHQPTNTPGIHTPPGAPDWHLPPSNMKMVFQGKTPRELALQLVDTKRNGNKNKQQLLDHAKDGLVKAGWDMGEGRKPPPLSYNEFVKAWNTWIETGAYAPKR
jgi:hypothetical protein